MSHFLVIDYLQVDAQIHIQSVPFLIIVKQPHSKYLCKIQEGVWVFRQLGVPLLGTLKICQFLFHYMPNKNMKFLGKVEENFS